MNNSTLKLLNLADGCYGLRTALRIESRDAQSDGRPVLDFVASNEALDRMGEVVCASGWHLDRYRQNPVFQNAHQYGDIIFTLGKAVVTDLRDGRLFQSVEFAVDANPLARVAYQLYRGKFLNAVSVGFIPIRWENGTAQSEFRRKYLEQELIEVSAVPVPANPEALALGIKAGAVAKSDVRSLYEVLRTVCAASGPPREIINFARQLRAAMA